MSKLLEWFSNLIPAEYKIGVAIKKLSYTVGKLAAGYITAKLVTTGKLTPEQCSQIQMGLTAGIAGGLTLVQDWAKLKYPDAVKYL